MEKVAIHVEDMTIAYHEKPVIWDIDIDIIDSSITAIIGPNGAGKSTLIKGILQLIKPLSGVVSVYGKPYNDMIKEIAYVPQSSSVNWDFPTTVFDVVLMGRYGRLGWLKRPTKHDKEIAMDALVQIGMQDFKDRQISQLSGGQRQRVFLARAIAQDANIYFLDEPLQGIDIKSEAIIMDILKKFQKQGKTVVVVHHDLNSVNQYFDHVIIINKKLIAQGTLEQAFTKENIGIAYNNKGLDRYE